MNLEDVKKYTYWYDDEGELWKRTSYCAEPTVTLERVNKYPSNGEGTDRHNIGISGLTANLFKPVEIEALK